MRDGWETAWDCGVNETTGDERAGVVFWEEIDGWEIEEGMECD